jgi:sarcosine oxidase subunit beta
MSENLVRADASGKKGASVVIVGGGVTGLSTAWWLAQEGVDVLVLDKGIVGWEASGRNGGGTTHTVSTLFKEEQRLWPMMDELLGYPTEFRPADGLDPKQVRELVPLVGDNIAGGVFCNYGGHANPQRTVQAYAWALQDRGGRIRQHTAVTDIVTEGGRVVAVETDQGRIGCDVLVMATGPQTRLMAEKLGVKVPVAPARAEMIVTEPLPLMTHGGIDGGGLYGRQTLRGNLAYGGGPHEWLEEQGLHAPRAVTTPITRSLARRLGDLFPRARHVRVIRSWAGIVENTPDGRPVLDRLDNPGNVVIATMSSVGFGLSPASGRAVAQLATKGQCDFADLRQFGVKRFAALGPDWREKLGWVPWTPEAGENLVEAAS